MGHKMKVLVPFRNVRAYLRECVDSITSQHYDHVEVFLLDDGSSDRSLDAIGDHERVNKIRFDAPRGVSHNAASFLRQAPFGDEDVIVFVDGDDRLIGADVFTVIDNLYQDGALVTYGSYVRSDGTHGFCHPHWPAEFRCLRAAPFKAGHLKTFKYGVYKQLLAQDPAEDAFKDELGRYLPMSSDVALMLPMMEIAGPERVAFNYRVVYFYRLHRRNDHATAAGHELQTGMTALIRRKRAFARVF
jgi:glycosyltransferase involved in cell wall biosynthesis